MDVANDITVTIPGGLARSDTEIAQAIRHTLEWDVFVPDDRITSMVTDGWVTLEGTVEELAQRDDAERAARNVAGVKSVVNKITVTSPKPGVGDVREAIERALERRAEREARRIRVAVADGTVTLTGSVRHGRNTGRCSGRCGSPPVSGPSKTI
jgi:osmotically-inducible protein OsmY